MSLGPCSPEAGFRQPPLPGSVLLGLLLRPRDPALGRPSRGAPRSLGALQILSTEFCEGVSAPPPNAGEVIS